MWSESLAEKNFKNWAWKAKKHIKDFGGLLSTDELWDALTQQEMSQWKNTVLTPPQDSETGGRFGFCRKFKSHPSAEGYNILNSVVLSKRRILS
jgi:hypothetical protein